jgi:hypothetical protein
MSRAPRAWIEHMPRWADAPMAWWVHVPQDGQMHDATRFDPPAPAPHGRKGYAVLCVQFGEHVLRFSSPAQLDEAIRVLAMKPLPTTRRLSALRAAATVPTSSSTRLRKPGLARTEFGPNSHWLSRLPASLKATKARAKVVDALRGARAGLVRGDGFVAPP